MKKKGKTLTLDRWDIRYLDKETGRVSIRDCISQNDNIDGKAIPGRIVPVAQPDPEPELNGDLNESDYDSDESGLYD